MPTRSDEDGIEEPGDLWLDVDEYLEDDELLSNEDCFSEGSDPEEEDSEDASGESSEGSISPVAPRNGLEHQRTPGEVGENNAPAFHSAFPSHTSIGR